MRVIHVAVGVLYDSQGRVLITRRPDHVHQGGLWEFPGGKVEPGEEVLQALTRELHEELGVELRSARPLIRVHHAYPDKSVLLDVWRIQDYVGEPLGLEGQPLDWLKPDALLERDLPAADKPIVNALRLPCNYLITGESADKPQMFLQRLEQALRKGMRLVQLRAKQLPESRLLDLYRQARDLTRGYQAMMLLNGSPEQARSVGADGLHLDSRRLLSLKHRPLGQDRWVAASCHNALELEQAKRLEVDFVVVAPIAITATHPQAVPLGWNRFRDLTEQSSMPVYALGGMTPADVPQAWACGAQGIAAIRSLW